MQNLRQVAVGGPSIVFTREGVVDDTFISIEANQLYLCFMCQLKPTGVSTRWEYDREYNRFTPQQNKSRNFENMVMSYFQ